MVGCFLFEATLAAEERLKSDDLLAPVEKDCTDYSVAFSPNGEYIAASGAAVCVWNYKTGELIHRFPAPANEASLKEPKSFQMHVMAIAFSPDSHLLIGGHYDGTVRRWDVLTGEEKSPLIGHQGVVRAVAFSPNGKLIASGGTDWIIRIWDTETGKEVSTLDSYKGSIETVNFSPDGHTLVGGGTDNVRLWDVHSGKEIGGTSKLKNAIRHAEFSPDGKRVHIVGFRGFIGSWEIHPKQEVQWVGDNLQNQGFPADLSPNGQYLILGGSGDTGEDTITLFNATTGKVLKVFQVGQALVRGLRFSPDGRFFAAAQYTKPIQLWNFEEDKPTRSFK